jgi:hypothetical protein
MEEVEVQTATEELQRRILPALGVMLTPAVPTTPTGSPTPIGLATQRRRRGVWPFMGGLFAGTVLGLVISHFFDESREALVVLRNGTASDLELRHVSCFSRENGRGVVTELGSFTMSQDEERPLSHRCAALAVSTSTLSWRHSCSRDPCVLDLQL